MILTFNDLITVQFDGNTKKHNDNVQFSERCSQLYQCVGCTVWCSDVNSPCRGISRHLPSFPRKIHTEKDNSTLSTHNNHCLFKKDSCFIHTTFKFCRVHLKFNCMRIHAQLAKAPYKIARTSQWFYLFTFICYFQWIDFNGQHSIHKKSKLAKSNGFPLFVLNMSKRGIIS